MPIRLKSRGHYRLPNTVWRPDGIADAATYVWRKRRVEKLTPLVGETTAGGVASGTFISCSFPTRRTAVVPR